uniref:Uncharacterized protein LOC108044941 n=1 Tax=Drosophila rhopaloa TaxID=1041015 RepID=A0A6P4ESC2_DRORH
MSTANCAPIAVGPSADGADSGASGRPPSWSGPPLATCNGEASTNGVGPVPHSGVGASSAACAQPPSWSGPPLLTTSSHHVEPLCATSVAQTAHGFVLPGGSIHNVATASPVVGSYASMTPNGIQGSYGPRRLPNLPVFGGQPEEWSIFNCAFVETTQAYNCTDLENNQRLLKALKDEAHETVKSLLIHPGNVSAVMEQLRPICGGQHGATSCREFIGASPPDRWSMVRRHWLCFTCLRSGHTTRSCDAYGECQVNGCRKLHHRLLHGADEERRWPARGGFRRHNGGNQQSAVSRRGPDRRSSPRGGYRDHEGSLQSAAPRNSLEKRAPQPEEVPVQRNLSCVDAEGGRLLFRILPVTLYGAGRQVDTYALLDEGSSVTMIDDELRRDLGVRGERRQLNIQWFGGRASREPSNVVSLEISGAGKPTRHALTNVYSVSSLSLPMQTLGRRDVQGVHKDARLPMKPYTNVVPKLLIGLDNGHLGLPLRTRR